ncbi:MAG: hypothetical protein ACK5W9_06050 [Bdellovibrionales bacterium]
MIDNYRQKILQQSKKVSHFRFHILGIFSGFSILILLSIISSSDYWQKAYLTILKKSGLYKNDFILENGQKYAVPTNWFSITIINRNDIIPMQNLDISTIDVDLVSLPLEISNNEEEICSESFNIKLVNLINSKINRFSFNYPRFNRVSKPDTLILGSFERIQFNSMNLCHLHLIRGSSGIYNVEFIYSHSKEKNYGFIFESKKIKDSKLDDVLALFN